MELKKDDWLVVREAEEQGLMVAMTSQVELNRTDLNKELSAYFKDKMPGYRGTFDEYDGENLLYSINEYIKDNNIDKYLLEFPLTSGDEIYLVPINDNIKLKFIVVDDYYGSGDYSKYVMSDFFLINENTSKEDVDLLVEFIKNMMMM